MKHIDLLIALNKPLPVDCMLLKETDLFDAITVIIDLISENNLINVDVKDIKTISYGAKEIGFYSFEIERRGKVISAYDVITHLLSKSHTENKKINQFIEYFKEFLNHEFIMSNKNKSQFIPNLLEKLDDEERRNAFEMVMTAIKNREEIYRVLAEKLEQSLIDKLSSSKYQDWKLITINKNGDTILPIYISNDKYSFDIFFESNGRTYCGLRFKDSVNEELKERDNEILNKIIIEGADRATTKYPIWFYPNYPITDKWNEKSWTQLASDVDSVTKAFWNPIEMLLDGLNKAESGK